jgi:hypothetical protein
LSLWLEQEDGYLAVFNTTVGDHLPGIQYIMLDRVNDGFLDYDGIATSYAPIVAVAAECKIQLGVQALQDRVENAKYSVEEIGFWAYGEPVTDTTSNITLLAWWHDLTGQWASLDVRADLMRWPPGFNDNTTFDADANDPAATDDQTYQSTTMMSNFFQEIFGGNFFTTSMYDFWTPSSPVFGHATMDTLKSIYEGNMSGCAESDDRLSCGVENVAKAMTKVFRDSAYADHGLELANVTVGETKVVISYVRINWFWFALPLSVWTMAAVLWISTVIHTRRMKVSAWANNILPLLFLYRGDVGKEEVGQQGTSNADYLRRSERIAVQLQFADGKAKLE